jgi:hypothetical protein
MPHIVVKRYGSGGSQPNRNPSLRKCGRQRSNDSRREASERRIR